jgi:N6-adenosine-specific RNA methylase IME4
VSLLIGEFVDGGRLNLFNMGELAKIESYCELTKTSLIFKRDITKEEWMDGFNSLKKIEGCIQFWIGDFLAYRQQKWGMYDDIAEETGYDKTTLRHIKNITENIESGRRQPLLSFSHHSEIASLPPEKQTEFLNKAVEEKLSVRELREEIRKDGIEFNLDSKLPEGKFQVVYADPPWKYGNSMPEYFKEQANYYPLMNVSDVADMPIIGIVDKNAVLFLWVTSPILEECFRVIESWGFIYKTSFIWDKIKHNMGHYSSVRHEILLLCIRGSYPIQNKKLYDSVLSLDSKKFQYEIGENLQGFEIKYDARCTGDRGTLATNQLSIEIAEKTKDSNLNYIDSGIYRNDNSWLYIQGNYMMFWIFSKRILKLLHKSGRYKNMNYLLLKNSIYLFWMLISIVLKK